MKPALYAITLASTLWLAGCEAVGGILGAGVGAVVKKDQENQVSETFTHSVARTKAAVLAALKRMRIDVTSSEGEEIKAKAKDEPVEVKLEAVTDKTTRMTVKIGESLRRIARRRRRSWTRRSARSGRNSPHDVREVPARGPQTSKGDGKEPERRRQFPEHFREARLTDPALLRPIKASSGSQISSLERSNEARA